MTVQGRVKVFLEAVEIPSYFVNFFFFKFEFLELISFLI